MRVRLLFLLVLAVFLSLPAAVTALALSDVELDSHLNQRLSARIRLTGIAAGELEGLNISVKPLIDSVTASRQAVLQHEVVEEGSNYYLVISSRDTIREPILRFVVELDWSSGHLLRNYALIIDPK